MEEKAKREALRAIPHGVYIIGTKDKQGQFNAYTGTWLTQTSFRPPLIVIAVKLGTSSQQMIEETQVFSVNVLAKEQKNIAARFIRTMDDLNAKFEDVPAYKGKTGAPILKDALSFFECRVVEKIKKGDHWVYMGEVINAGVHKTGEPLHLEDTSWEYGG